MIKAPRFFWSGILLGFIGCLFYANFREPKILFDLIPLFSWFSFVEQPITLPNAISEWIPSFLHIIGMSFFTVGIIGLGKGNYWKVPVAWLAIDLIFEGLQYFQTGNLLTWGNFEWLDVVAMFISTLATVSILKKSVLKNSQLTPKSTNFSNYTKHFLQTVAFSVGAFMMLGSYEYGLCDFPDETSGKTIKECEVTPIYLSWEKVRESGQLMSVKYGENYQQPLKDSNKIYTYQHMLIINEERVGIHFFDNTDPENPSYIDFISLIGNQDMAIKNQYLYLDSFTDLIIFDLTDITAPPVRKQNVFNFPDPEASLPEDMSFSEKPEAPKGVVIGYQNFLEEKFYFWSDFSGLEE